MQNQFMTSKQAAEMLCMSTLTMRKWRWEGKGPKFIKAGSKVLYRLTDIEAWTNQQTRSSTSDTGEVL